jgi:hypothetical protein
MYVCDHESLLVNISLDRKAFRTWEINHNFKQQTHTITVETGFYTEENVWVMTFVPSYHVLNDTTFGVLSQPSESNFMLRVWDVASGQCVREVTGVVNGSELVRFISSVFYCNVYTMLNVFRARPVHVTLILFLNSSRAAHSHTITVNVTATMRMCSVFWVSILRIRI